MMPVVGADLIPDPTTAGDFCRRFTEADVLDLMGAINQVRPRLWAGRGLDLLGPITYLDVDGTIVPTTGSRKQGMDMSYKGIWGYAPLIVSLAKGVNGRVVRLTLVALFGSLGADDEDLSGGVDDVGGDGVEVVDAHDAGNLSHEAFDEAEVAAGDLFDGVRCL